MQTFEWVLRKTASGLSERRWNDTMTTDYKVTKCVG